jgi:hypothetical protein
MRALATDGQHPKKSFNTMTNIEKKADEMSLFYEYLSDKITSCTDASKVLNIPQKHLTRYKRKFQQAGTLQVVKMNRCPHTRRWVQFITTDKSKFVQPVQLPTIFD